MYIYRLVRNVMSTVQEVAFAFDNSAKKLHAVFDEREADTANKVNMKKGQNYESPVKCDGQIERTQLYTFKTSYRVVVHELKCLQNQADDKAGQFLASIMRFQLS